MESTPSPKKTLKKKCLIIVEISCPSCHHTFNVNTKEKPKFCPFCAAPLRKKRQKSSILSEVSHAASDSIVSEAAITFIPGHAPVEKQVQFSLGPYKILESIGKGGMGEVFLAYDTTCGRRIALKRIREDLLQHRQVHHRFLKEAHITSQLTHPAIIPIYTIHAEQNLAYYIMPFVEGETLKQILKKARKQDKLGIKAAQTSSIPSLMRIFLSICHAIAYAHSKDVLHRDLKLENIIVGKYGEVVILDWGLAKLTKTFEEEEEAAAELLPEDEHHPLHHLTRLGKVVGTIAYMAPERGLGQPASFQTDIYSLGVILYQMLTLRHPFKRGTLKEFRKNMAKEKLLDPIDVAPYRDVPRILSRAALKCLAVSLDQRYKMVQELIYDLETYLEGRSEWFHIADLDINHKEDWEFQENVLIAEHTAITRSTEISDWVSLMISKGSFTENTKIEAKIKLGEKCQGIGFLLSIPEAAERSHLNDGYCLWLGSDSHRSTKLLRSAVEVMNHPDIYLQRHDWYTIRIEKIDQNIHFYLNNILQFSYISHLPLAGTHIGLLSRDADYALSPLHVSVGSLNIRVNCLAVPDAFLAHKDYNKALSEYRRIGYSFPGTAEGREALFRAGVTLLEEARNATDPVKKQELYELSLEEFWKLHVTPGAPLGYLGKALVYQALDDPDEEIKCFELAYRRYPHHPLLPVLEEQILYRMLESSRHNRKATYQFILFAIRHIPSICTQNNAKKLFNSLQRHWEPLPFMLHEAEAIMTEKLKNMDFAIHLAFWTAKPYTLSEIIDDLCKMDPIPLTLFTNSIFALIELGSYALAKAKLNEAVKKLADEPSPEFLHEVALLNIAIRVYQQPIQKCFENLLKILHLPVLEKSEIRIIMHLIRFAIKKRNYPFVLEVIKVLNHDELDAESALQINCTLIAAYLGEGDWTKAGELLQAYPLDILHQETKPLHFLYGSWLYKTKGKDVAQAHFSGVLEISFPRTWTLFGHLMHAKIDENQAWLDKAFLWEKRQLYMQAAFFYHCIGNEDLSNYYANLEAQQYIYAKA
jgi:eukaryotic-like serine/threonine-protein kinase